MATSVIGTAIFSVRATLDKLDRDLAQAREKTESSMTQTGRAMTRTGMTLTKTLTPIAGAAGLMFRQAFNEWDSGIDAIRAGTGATGAELEKLGESMKRVGGQVTQPLSEVGVVLAEVATRTGLTGKGLEHLTKQILDLNGRLNNTASVENVTRMFGDWSIKTRDQSKALDLVFRASQASGVSIDELASTVVQFGAPLRNLGFTFEQSIAMFAKWGKEGVNLQTVMAGLRMGLKTFAKAGEEPIDALQRAITQIEKAGSSAEANTLAFEVFGVRAGPDLAAAIREGRFDLKEMLDTVEKGKDTIRSAADDTLDWSDRLAMLKNKVFATIGPVGELGMALAGIAAGIGPALIVGGKLLTVLGLMGKNADGATMATGRLTGALKGMAAVGGIVAAVFAIKAAVDALGLSAKGLEIHVERIAGASRRELDRMAADIPMFIRAFESAGGSAQEVFRKLVDESVPAARAISDAMRRNGQDTEQLDRMIKRKTESEIRSTRRTGEHSAAVQEGAEKQKGYKHALDETTGSIDDQTGSLQKSLDPLLAVTDAELRHRQALDRVTEARGELNDVLAEFGPDSEEARRATDRLREAELDATRATIGLTESTDALKKKIEETPGGARALIVELERQKQLHPELGHEIDLQIGRLKGLEFELFIAGQVHARPQVTVETHGQERLDRMLAVLRELAQSRIRITAETGVDPLPGFFQHGGEVRGGPPGALRMIGAHVGEYVISKDVVDRIKHGMPSAGAEVFYHPNAMGVAPGPVAGAGRGYETIYLVLGDGEVLAKAVRDRNTDRARLTGATRRSTGR